MINFAKNKRGVSVMVGYILLVVFVVVISALVYGWLVTYVPTDPLNCPDGVSVFVKDAVFDSSNSQLNLTLKNSGRFNFAGYFIHAKTSSSQELATTDLSGYLNESFGGVKFGNAVLFISSGNNALTPNNEQTHNFNLDLVDAPYSVRIIPTRFQIEDNRERFVSCGDSKVEQIVGAPGVVVECVPDTCSGLEYFCGEWDNSCSGTIDCGLACDTGFFCNSTGKCESGTCPDTCPSLGYECNTQTVCGISTDCGTCTSGFSCNATGQCEEILCGNNVLNTGEVCDGGTNCIAPGQTNECQCPEGDIADGSNGCVLDTSGVSSCAGYCVLLNYGTGSCTNSVGNCQNGGDTYESGGDLWCTGGAQADTCCCQP